MRERIFRFKQFSVAHSRSAMKVGVDGVLIGAWATPAEGHILDVGTGCGMIALMMAQRSPQAMITGIDIHADSVEEARENVESNGMQGRIDIQLQSFDDIPDEDSGYDLIVSNPPFFDSGVKNPATPREQARHTATLTPESLLINGVRLLNPMGRISLIATSDAEERLLSVGREVGLAACRITHVRDHADAKVKRVMMEFAREGDKAIDCERGELVMFGEDGEPTYEYRQLCKDFYLKF